MKASEFTMRDPYILLHDGTYYLYGTRSETCWGPAEGFDCYKSPDLLNWEGPVEIFKRTPDFFATENFWAPEAYYYRGSFWLLTTLGGAGLKKGIYVLKSDSPEGPFALYSGRLTPEDWTCIDGSLLIEEGRVWLVFSHSFEDAPDADICVQELAADLSCALEGPRSLFPAKAAPWALPVPFAAAEFGMAGDVYFSDGPGVFRGEDGRLYMTWSSWSKAAYAVGAAVSESGSVYGPWKQQETPIWPANGGHGMVFKDKAGVRCFALHFPNDKGNEHFCYKKLAVNEDGSLCLED